MIPSHINCDSCSQAILPSKPRVHCLTCTDYDLCADCALSERFTGQHDSSHRTQIYQLSGGGDLPPSLSDTVSLTYTSPVHQSPTPSSPPPLPPRRQSSGPPPPLPPRSNSGSSASGRPTPSTVPPSPHIPPTNPPNGSADRSEMLTWSPLFDDYMDVTTVGDLFFNAIFTYLDPSYTGYLTPEVYSRFLDDQGYLLHENVWKSNLVPDAMYGGSKENMADKALRNAYDLFSIEHILKHRHNPSGSTTPSITTQLQGLFGNAFNPAMMHSVPLQSSNSQMPLLTRKGFIDITTVEVLSDPSRAWGNLSRLLRAYQLEPFRGWGDMPRNVLPEAADERMLQRVRGVSSFAKMRGEQQLASTMAEMELRRQGRENALDLISDTRYKYVYR
ncbi:uncharacterized protein EV420DRAFT_1570613 [Desarmillaria tabescens]|uniref:ZZ-type domain-containing protein n=1 Tax=Armillaria tabescens TaxID=1929756 RepID=A0AA39MUM4_ARMTA|nr:uncharacterized protein EV420DRAFT_1570613 [Desarmillaria tabescens]KAK0446435.1 hypothetical protein EV420DRAFT_1570613 [Desarmillaria tabescens]